MYVTNLICKKPHRQSFVRPESFSICCGLAVFLLLNSLLLSAQSPSLQDRDNQIDTYLTAIEEAETQNGPYALELVDLYYGYGQALVENGDLEPALDAFQQTAMISRVNHGPNSLDQTNYLYSVAKVESMLGNLEPSIEVLEYIYQVNARAFGERDPAMLPVVEQIFDWYEEEKPLAAIGSRSTDYQNQSFLAARISDLTASQYGLGSTEAAFSYRRQGQLHFRSIFYMFRTGNPPIPELVINGGESGNAWVVERSISNHFRAGAQAFENAVEAWRQNPEATSLEVAEAIAQLGDWYLVMEQFRAAAKQYKRAYQLLAGDGSNQALAEEYFQTPTPLRFLGNKDPFVRTFDRPDTAQGLEVLMTVTRNGRLTHVELRNIPKNESPEDIQTVKQRLERTRFRPALQMGEVIQKENYLWKPPPMAPKIASNEKE